MNRTTLRTVLVCLICGSFLSAAADGVWAAQSIQYFNSLKEKWPDLIGIRFRLEGRYALIGKNLLQFENCELYFRSEKDFPKLTGTSRTLEVVGTLVKEEGKLYFAVEEMKERPNDLDQFRIRQVEFRNGTADDWFELGDWAMRRGSFYGDEELIRRAGEAYSRGLRIARRGIRSDNSKALFELAEKARTFGLPDAQANGYAFEACQHLWQVAKVKSSTTEQELQNLQELIARELPGSTRSLPQDRPELRKRYHADPYAAYRSAAAEQRLQLHRILYGEVVLKAVLLDAAEDGSNGLQIAARIEERLPERTDLVDEYRRRELDFRAAQVGKSTRRQALELADHFRRRNQPRQARQALEDWLSARGKQLRQQGASGLVELADEYIALLNDQSTAYELLIEADKISPNSEIIADRLRRLGYRRRDGLWQTEDELRDAPPDPKALARREGRIVEGMTPDDVVQALGQPMSTVRLATAGRVVELWTYGPRGTSRMVIRFVRPVGRKGVQPAVSEVIDAVP